MTAVDIDKVGLSDFTVTVQPINTKTTRGTVYEDAYKFGEVHHDFDADAVFPEDSAVRRVNGEKFIYQFASKPPIMVTRDEVGTIPAASLDVAEQQAYFCLSILESDGYVSGWRRA